MDYLDTKSVAIIGREQNGVVLNYDRSIIITTDILKWSENVDDSLQTPTITLDELSEKVEVFAKNVLLNGDGSTRDPESVVYGESLVELLRWMITVLKTHKHPPNASPIPDFYVEADSRYRNMEKTLLNKRVKSR